MRTIALLLTAALVIALAPSGASARGFMTQKARERIREIHLEYRRHYERDASQYFGRLWARQAKTHREVPGGITTWQRYRARLQLRGRKPIRLDCTLYAAQILAAGMTPEAFRRLWQEHRTIWRGRGLAGWSVAHILITKHGWTAYAVIHPKTRYHAFYLKHFRHGIYPVWKQPDLPIAKYFILEKDDRAIERLLRKHPFGWGFSNGGIHTWITMGRSLEECIWDAAPGKRFVLPTTPPMAMFRSTRFIRYRDFGAHLLVFPP